MPWIRFGIYNPKSPTTKVFPIGLLDTGSEISFIDTEIGEALGFPITKGYSIDVKGVGGGTIKVYLHKVGIYLESNKDNEVIDYTGLVGFTNSNFPKSMPQQTAILGTLGFFEYVSARFDHPKEMTLEQNMNHKFFISN